MEKKTVARRVLEGDGTEKGRDEREDRPVSDRRREWLSEYGGAND